MLGQLHFLLQTHSVTTSHTQGPSLIIPASHSVISGNSMHGTAIWTLKERDFVEIWKLRSLGWTTAANTFPDGHSKGVACNWEEIKPVQWSILVHVHSRKGLRCGHWPDWGMVWSHDNDSQTSWDGQGSCHHPNRTCRQVRVRVIPQGRGGHYLGVPPCPQGAAIPSGAQDTVRSYRRASSSPPWSCSS